MAFFAWAKEGGTKQGPNEVGGGGIVGTISTEFVFIVSDFFTGFSFEPDVMIFENFKLFMKADYFIKQIGKKKYRKLLVKNCLH